MELFKLTCSQHIFSIFLKQRRSCKHTRLVVFLHEFCTSVVYFLLCLLFLATSYLLLFSTKIHTFYSLLLGSIIRLTRSTCTSEYILMFRTWHNRTLERHMILLKNMSHESSEMIKTGVRGKSILKKQWECSKNDCIISFYWQILIGDHFQV